MSDRRTHPPLAPGTVLAALALALGVLAPIAGAPRHPPGAAGTGVAELSRELADGAPLVDAVTLGEWIRDRRPLDVIDLRDPGAFTRFAIPTARNARLPGLREPVAGGGGRTILLYDDHGGEAIRGWLLLRRLGYSDVRVLEGGVEAWIEGVLSPVLPANTPEERTRYRRVAGVSRYFGGVPRVGERPPARARSAEEAVQLLSRRGCY